MALKLGTVTVDRVLIIDDDANSRQGYSYTIEDLGLRPILQASRLQALNRFVPAIRKRADAVFSDFKLRICGAYASYDGDSLVAECYKNRIPAVLCTTFTDVDHHVNRKNLRYIPAFLRTDDPQPDAIENGFKRCVEEFSGIFSPSRKPWRTLVRVYDVDEKRDEFHVIIPGWNIDKKVGLHLSDMSSVLRPKIKPEKRFHAQVNLGVESHSDLYFDKWELD